MYDNNEIGRELSWDDEIRNDGPDYVLLPEGDYTFEVTKLERARFQGSAKLPPCAMAILSISVDGGNKGTAFVTHRLYLHTRTEGLLCAFFESIGQRKHGEPLRPRWNEVAGSHGKCRLGVHEYTKKDGTPGRSNEIQRFLPPDEPAATAAPAQGSWVQGRF